ncbi:uncharacterized protein LOC109797484 [Cajanus cajan]|uniref:Kinase D-interacting substrate of n=1 Tax=Cajanus cajan TaxID=3821 RepID=A0A151U8S1_CAJCA|nr:uncharacterized protein LOC109797484 [Cajanus cajan]KYP75710.1 Kinase D-interacting substrate of [Cajanus cajan]
MCPSYLPLRWESTGEQWWYATPIDCAAANGHYDLVVELLHLDANLLTKLTSLRRIRRLETVWDDQARVAKHRSHVARSLMLECEAENGRNSLIRAGYGGWLLYTAASAGDADFVRELLGKRPALVFGEGEYGVTDILYGAARSNVCEVFEILLRCALSPREGAAVDGVFQRDMVNRAAHAAARGGNWEMLKKILEEQHSPLLEFRDANGCTVLHSAAGRGQVQVVRNLLASFDVVNLTDAQGNTALHVASYGGHLPVVEILILASPSLALLTNHYGDTFLHMAVAGFRCPGFRRLDKHIELMKLLVSGKIVNLQDIINVKNNDGRTALHVSVMDNIQCELVELLMSVPSIDLNICDVDGMTPLDLLKQKPRSASSDILIKRIISSGGVSSCKDAVAGNAFCNNHKGYVIGGSPGTSFRIPDAEIFLYTAIENSSDANYEYDQASVESHSCSNELSNSDSPNSPRIKKSSSVNYASRPSKFRLKWARRRDTRSTASELEDDHSLDPFSSSRNLEEFPIPLRQRYSQPCSLPNNKRTSLPSPSSKVKFTSGVTQGVIQLKPHPSPFQELSVASLSSIKKEKGADIMGPSSSNRSIDDGTLLLNYKQCSFNKKLMNGYFSFGAQGLAVEDSNSCAKSNRSYKRLSSLVA